MNYNSLHLFTCVGAFYLTLIAHWVARYLVNTPIFPKTSFQILGFNGSKYSYNPFILACINLFFCIFFTKIFPSLPLEKAIAFSIFYFTLAVTIITDFYTYLISTLATLYLLPVAFFYAYNGYLNITLFQSISTALAVGISSHTINYLYTKRKGTGAFGEGDRDLLLYIGAFLGTLVTLSVIFYASLIGSIWGLIVLATNKSFSFNSYILPFGTCLGLGVFTYTLLSYFYGTSLLYFL